MPIHWAVPTRWNAAAPSLPAARRPTLNCEYLRKMNTKVTRLPSIRWLDGFGMPRWWLDRLRQWRRQEHVPLDRISRRNDGARTLRDGTGAFVDFAEFPCAGVDGERQWRRLRPWLVREQSPGA